MELQQSENQNVPVPQVEVDTPSSTVPNTCTNQAAVPPVHEIHSAEKQRGKMSWFTVASAFFAVEVIARIITSFGFGKCICFEAIALQTLAALVVTIHAIHLAHSNKEHFTQRAGLTVALLAVLVCTLLAECFVCLAEKADEVSKHGTHMTQHQAGAKSIAPLPDR